MTKYISNRGITEKTIPEPTELEENMNLEYYLNQLLRCGKCGQCRYVFQDAFWSRVCPSGELRKFESYYLGGKNLLLWALTTGKIEWSQHLTEILYHCTLCGNCTQQCQIDGIHKYALNWLLAAREKAVELGFGPMPQQKDYAQSIKQNHNPYYEPHNKRLEWLPKEKLPKKAEIIYFVGCTSSYRTQNIAKATYTILKKSKINFTILADEWCCGSPLIWTGQKDKAKQLAQHNLSQIEESEAQTIVTSCAGCYRTLKEAYKQKLKINHNLQVLHTTELIDNLIKEGKLKLRKANLTVTYHDPCHLGRHMGIYEQPRRILKAMKLQLNEMTRNKHNAWCCGAGAGVKAAFKKLANYAAKERLKEALETKAKILATSCPFCLLNFKETQKTTKIEIQIQDITELIQKHLP